LRLIAAFKQLAGDNYWLRTKTTRRKTMRLAQTLINLPVFSISGGHELGKVKDLYLDDGLKNVTAIYLGNGGLLSRSDSFIRQAEVITLGQDAVLVRKADNVLDEAEMPELSEWKKRWVRLADLQGREMKTPGGTKIGRIGDVVLDEEASIAGFSLSQISVSGPVADNKVISRSAFMEPVDGREDGVITVELAEAEQADLRIENEDFFSEPSVAQIGESEEATERV
jgi:sporulation protein YlmC with PRC-barrel domain